MSRSVNIASLYNDNALMIMSRESSDICFATMDAMGAYGETALATFGNHSIFSRVKSDLPFPLVLRQMLNDADDMVAGTMAEPFPAAMPVELVTFATDAPHVFASVIRTAQGDTAVMTHPVDFMGLIEPAPVWVPPSAGRLLQTECFDNLAVQWPNKSGDGHVFARLHTMTVGDLTDPQSFTKILKAEHAKYTL